MHLPENHSSIETIICPVDFSCWAENTLQYADQLAQRTHSRLILLHCYSINPIRTQEIMPPDLSASNLEYEQFLEAELQKLQHSLRKAHPNSSLPYENRVRYGALEQTLIQLTALEPADLIVMGLEEPPLAGSVAIDMIEQSTCPVLIIPPYASYHPFKRIVVASDLDETAFPDTGMVFEIARSFGAEVDFFHLLEKEVVGARAVAWESFKKIHHYFPYNQVTFYSSIRSDLDEAIQEFVKIHEADLLVMANHPRKYWQYWEPESQTKQMAHHTRTPLLAIHCRPWGPVTDT